MANCKICALPCDLVFGRFLSRQTARRVGLTPYRVVAAGTEAILRQWSELREAGVAITVVDCLDDTHAAAIAEAACDLKLISGSSVFGAQLPSAWRRRGWLGAPASRLWEGIECCPGKGRLVVAGSCSVATAAQNAWLARSGARVFDLDVRVLIEDGAGEAADRAAHELARGVAVLLKTRSSAEDILTAQQWGAACGWSAAELGLKIAGALAGTARKIVEGQTPSVLVSAGGETTGALCRAMGIRALAVDRNIQPGVPLCYPLEGMRVPMALKSGNFGTEDFYGVAFAAAGEVRSGT